MVGHYMAQFNRQIKLAALLRLSRELGHPSRPLAILAEGNTSVRLNKDLFLVKASGGNLGTLDVHNVVECRGGGLLALLDKDSPSDEQIEAALLASRVNTRAKKPSVEALFHAYLLTLPGIEFVGHAHGPAANSILCSPRAREFAEKRLFPDEIVCCDVASVFIPYTDPGLQLARAIRKETGKFIARHGRVPRVILLQNHGIITLGRSSEAVLSAMLMAEKAATIWVGAAAAGGPKFLSSVDTARIAGRLDEALRRQILKL
jgi:rhamnose utilization protein RhaD (predicted bifunctional aldolase and dehydrogenase)